MWLLIDGNNWFAQCDYASPQSGTRNLLARIDTLRRQIDHSLIAVCWDPRESFRTRLNSKYKAHRTAKPDDYHARLRHARVAVSALRGVTSHCSDQFEADDLIASLVRRAHDEGERSIIFSADRDLHQLLVSGLVTQVTQVHRITRDQLKFTVCTACSLQTHYGVSAEQWVDYRCIIGDKSDGIDGCPGLGPVAASNVLRCCRTLEGFYRSPLSPNLTARQRTALLAYRDQVPLKRQLLTLVDDCPLTITPAVTSTHQEAAP